MTLRTSAVGLLLFLLACRYEFSQDEAKALVRSIGEERIRIASDALKPLAKQDGNWTYVERSRWASVFQELQATSLQVNREGVWIGKSGFYVEAEGLFVPFRGTPEPEERSGDPSIWRVGKRVYWYKFIG